MKHTCLLFLLSSLLWASCSPSHGEQTILASTARAAASEESPIRNFGDYWYQGKAEITSYTLQQARYGEIHSGSAVLVYVTEPFSKSKHVKLDNPNSNPTDKVDALKLNFTRKFTTGIYPYSMMTSVFSPVSQAEHVATLKTTCSSQEWCGHTFSQIDKTNTGWDMKQFSYFEGEGDQEKTLPEVWLEDEIWTQIRLNPEALPLGDFNIVPGSHFLRFSHEPTQARKAVGKLEVKKGGYTNYTISYPYNGRSLSIDFVTALPHEIELWSEKSKGYSGQTLETTGKLNKRIMSDYWNKNSVDDAEWRGKLGLD